jgi:hypothetical protein
MKIATTLFSALAAAFLAFSAAAQSKLPAFGMSYSYLDVDENKVATCKVSRGATMKADAFLPRYDQPGVRDKVRASLAQMHQSGFKEVRTLIWFGKIKEGDRDWLDVDDAARAARLVRQFYDDVAAAGLSGALLAFAPQGSISPMCHRGESYGKCFNGESTAQAFAFISAVRKGLGETPPVPMRFDIGPEMCPVGRPEALSQNMERYLGEVLPRYTAAFPRDKTAVSCSIRIFEASHAAAAADRQYHGTGPSLYMLAAYNRRGFDTPVELKRLLEHRPSKAPFVVSEINYGDRAHLQHLIDGFRSAKVDLEAVYFWPLRDVASGGDMDTAPPYDLRAATGGLAGAQP